MFKESMRYEYPLNESSLVFDVGGYRGEFARGIIELYKCKVIIFEPVFKIDLPNVVRAGLSDHNAWDDIFVKGDSTSLYDGGGERRLITLLKLSDFMRDKEINHVGLIKINIEGEEYRLLSHMIDEGIVQKFDHIQVQYHRNIPDYERLRNEINGKLSKTHACQWCFPFIWESWSIKSDI